MTPTPTTTYPGADTTTEPTSGDARLRVKSEGPVTGYVDGAWWPGSTDLAAELPALLAELGDRLGPVERISYHLGDWVPTERLVQLGDQLVRTGGFRSQHPHTVDVIAKDSRLTLLVVPSEASADDARHAITAAAETGDTTTVEDLLAAQPGTPA